MPWDVDAKRLLHYHGRHRDPEAVLVAGSWEEPHEPIEDGCPGGYQLSPLVTDLLRYIRRRTKDGGRVSNPFFDRLEDEIAIAAVMLYEEEQDRSFAYWDSACFEERRRKTKG